MVDADEFRLEAAELDYVAGLDRDQLRRLQQIRLGELVFEDAERQARAVNRHLQRAKHVRQRPDVVLMAVRQQDAADARRVLFKIADVRYDEVDAEHVFVREAEPAVDHDYVVAVLEHGYVLADLV